MKTYIHELNVFFPLSYLFFFSPWERKLLLFQLLQLCFLIFKGPPPSSSTPMFQTIKNSGLQIPTNLQKDLHLKTRILPIKDNLVS